MKTYAKPGTDRNERAALRSSDPSSRRPPRRFSARSGEDFARSEPRALTGSPARAVAQASARAGEPLASGPRRRLESDLGHSFRDVRIHHDDAADRAAASLGYHAFTTDRHHIFMARGRFAPDTSWGYRLLAHEAAHSVQQRALAETEPSYVQGFEGSLEGWVGGVGDSSNYTADITYKVFDTQGQLLHSQEFSSPGQRLNYRLRRNQAYVIQLIGRVSVFQDTSGWGGNHNAWSVRVDWPVTVAADGTVRMRPPSRSVEGGEGDAPWSIDFGLVAGSDTVGILFSLGSTENTTTTVSGAVGTSQSVEGGVEVGGEAAVEPGGVGGAGTGAVNVGGGVGTSQEVSLGREWGTSATLTRQFSLLVDLDVEPGEMRMEVGPITTQQEFILPFETNAADFTPDQRDELVREFLSLDPDPAPFRQRGAGLSIYVEGYASRVGESDHNRDLSRRRAEFVAQIARATLPGASIPDPGYLGEAAWARDVPESDNAQEHRVATVRVVDAREALSP